MIKYFKIRKPRTINHKEKQIKKPAEIYFAQKSFYGARKRKETFIPKKANLLIIGAHGSGKSKEIHRLFEKREMLHQRHTQNFVRLNCNDAVSDWININLGEALHDYTPQEMDPRTTYAKIQALVNYSEKAILYIDDIHKATGKKLEVLKDIMRVAKQWIITTEAKHTINKSILNLMRKNYTTVELSTTQAVDATNTLMFVFLVMLVLTGNIELAILVTAGRLALKGNNT